MSTRVRRTVTSRSSLVLCSRSITSSIHSLIALTYCTPAGSDKTLYTHALHTRALQVLQRRRVTLLYEFPAAPGESRSVESTLGSLPLNLKSGPYSPISVFSALLPTGFQEEAQSTSPPPFLIFGSWSGADVENLRPPRGHARNRKNPSRRPSRRPRLLCQNLIRSHFSTTSLHLFMLC